MPRFVSLFTFAAALLPAVAFAGPYAGPTPDDVPGAIDNPIAADDSRFVGWADGIKPIGSGTYFAPGGSTSISTSGYNSLGDLTADQIAAHDSPGYLTVTFSKAIRNGSGADFATFENGGDFYEHPLLYADLAYVQVSTDGVHFAQFQSISTNSASNSSDYTAPYGSGYAGINTTNVYNLAGKSADGYGVPFDLSDLSTDSLVTSGQVDLNNINYVRLIDIPGSGDFKDSLGNGIIDAWPTSGGTAGYDFLLGEGSGVGVINAVPEPAALSLLGFGAVALLRRRRHS